MPFLLTFIAQAFIELPTEVCAEGSEETTIGAIGGLTTPYIPFWHCGIEKRLSGDPVDIR